MGKLSPKGPRYCPSLEDKVYRFNNKDQHQIFLEPETLNNEIVVLMEFQPRTLDTQRRFLQTIEGLENVKK